MAEHYIIAAFGILIIAVLSVGVGMGILLGYCMGKQDGARHTASVTRLYRDAIDTLKGKYKC